MENIKLGLIGVGKWGTNYLRTIREIKHIDLNYVTSIKNVPITFLNKNCKVEKDWKKIISSKEIDGVIVATPPDTHYQILLECIKMNIPVLIEKPFVLKVEDAKKIVNLAKENLSLVYVDYIHLYHPAFLKLQQKLKFRKNFIDIKSISGNYGPFRSNIRALWDWAPHDIAMCLKLTKEIPKVKKVSYIERNFNHIIPGELINIKLIFPSGIQADLTVGNLLEKKEKKFLVNYEDYSLIYDSNSKVSLKQRFTNEIENCLYKGSEKPLTNIVKKFSNAIILKKTDFEDLDLSLNVTKLIDEIEKSLK